MDRLALTLQPSPYETPTSYISRLAARNYCEHLPTFCADVGIDLGAVSCGDAEAIRYVCRLAGIPEDSFCRTTILKTNTMKYLLGSEPMDTDTLNRGEVFVCPKCVRSAFERSLNTWDVVHQLHWQIPMIKRCVEHNERLIKLGEKILGPMRLDTTFQIVEHLDDVHAANAPDKPDAFDIYLTRRIYGHRGRSFADSLSIPALWRCSEALGVTLLYEKSRRRCMLDDAEQRAATLEGFKHIKQGQKSVIAALEKFNTRETRKRGYQPAPQFGEIQRLLRKKCDYFEDLEPFRKFIREYVISRFPIEAGTYVFGEKLDRRRFHSMRSAVKTAQIRRELVEEMLLERGLGKRDDEGLFVLDRPLSIETVDELKAAKRRFIGKREAAAYIGASETVFREVQTAKVLQPTTGRGYWERKGYDKQQLDALLSQLLDGTSVYDKVPYSLETLPRATRQARCDSPALLSLLLAGKLKAAGRLGSELRLNNLLLDKNDLKLAFPEQPRNGFTKTELTKKLAMDLPSLDRAIEEGLLQTKRMRSSRSRVTNSLVTPDSVRLFEERFFTLGMLRASRQEYSRLRPIDLSKLGLEPIWTEKGLRRVFRREDLPPDPIGELAKLEAEEA